VWCWGLIYLCAAESGLGLIDLLLLDSDFFFSDCFFPLFRHLALPPGSSLSGFWFDFFFAIVYFLFSAFFRMDLVLDIFPPRCSSSWGFLLFLYVSILACLFGMLAPYD
jgi:hypothetical protein